MTTTAIHLTASLATSRVFSPPATPFQFPRGIHVSEPAGIHEGYQLIEAKKDYWAFSINVSAERIASIFRCLVMAVDGPGSFIVEVGSPPEEEARLRRTSDAPFHIDVHYLDGLPPKRALSMFDRYADLYTHDGRTQVGFGSHQGVDEVYIGPYKIFRIFTRTPAKYIKALNRQGYQRHQRLKTIWNTCTSRTPCRRDVLSESPDVIGEMLARLQSAGLYFAERCEEPR